MANEKQFQAATVRNGNPVSNKYKVEKIQHSSSVEYKIYRYNKGAIFNDWDYISKTNEFSLVKDLIIEDFSIGNENVKVREL